MRDPVGVSGIKNCARCGEDHPDVQIATAFLRPFAPPEANGKAWTHWTICPVSGDPILIMVAK